MLPRPRLSCDPGLGGVVKASILGLFPEHRASVVALPLEKQPLLPPAWPAQLALRGTGVIVFLEEAGHALGLEGGVGL